MRSLTIILVQPFIKVRLQRFDNPVDLLAESHLVKLL